MTAQSPLHPGTPLIPEAKTLYTARLRELGAESASLQRQHRWLGYARLLSVALLLTLLWFAAVEHRLRWFWLLLPCAGFALAARRHTRVMADGLRARRAMAWYELGLARLEDRWAGLAPRTLPPTLAAEATDSLYAADLYLFGPGSLFELLCTTRTSLGEAALAGALLSPVHAKELPARQAAVAALRDAVALREAVAAAAGPANPDVAAAALIAWGQQSLPLLPNWLLWLAPLLALTTLGAGGWWATGHSAALLSALLLVNGSLTFLLQRRFQPLFASTEQASAALAGIAALLPLLEAEDPEAPLLRMHQAALRGGPQPASAALRQLARLAAAAEQRANFLTRVLDFGILYSVQLALRLQRWREQNGERLGGWFHAVGEMEALLALSAYQFEHPDDRFPELTPEVAFAADQLGHPLLPGNGGVRNSVTLDANTRLLVVSGSNMSGKSTLLRSVGVACVMARAGAPVRAQGLQLGPLQVAASIQLGDSLQGGRSRFYAEILRLRGVCELARQKPPVLFLLDELLAGTNSQDRLVGATGIIETLLQAGAIGLFSTHDLQLTHLMQPGTGLAMPVRNVHFQDQIEGDALRFDYTLRKGIITRNNGLDLMRLIGLDV